MPLKLGSSSNHLISDLRRCPQSHHLAGLVHLRAILLASLLAFRSDEAHGLDQPHATSRGGGQSRRVSAEISSSLDELRGARWTIEVSCRPLPRAPRRSGIPWWFDIRRQRAPSAFSTHVTIVLVVLLSCVLIPGPGSTRTPLCLLPPVLLCSLVTWACLAASFGLLKR